MTTLKTRKIQNVDELCESSGNNKSEHTERMDCLGGCLEHNYDPTCKSSKNYLATEQVLVYDIPNFMEIDNSDSLKIDKTVKQIVHELLENKQIIETKANETFCMEDKNRSVKIVSTEESCNEGNTLFLENVQNCHNKDFLNENSNKQMLSNNKIKEGEADCTSELYFKIRSLDTTDDKKDSPIKSETGTNTCVPVVKKAPMDDVEGPFYLNRKLVDVESYQHRLDVEKWNPTQMLYEICSINHWNKPDFCLVDFVWGQGFLFCVRINGIVFYSTKRGKSKQLAKHYASTKFLRFIGFKFNFDDSLTPERNMNRKKVDTTGWIRPRVTRENGTRRTCSLLRQLIRYQPYCYCKRNG
uniref:DRBM domain-containing protein n=1 Tax=Cuerna arida TaxID=1464854 RepID=A0A1B6H0I1_9HEMI